MLPMNKAFILQEIRRTATENGGVPLGWRRFIAETGITQADFMRHWPRWNDAVAEAGFIPNKLSDAYDADYLIVLYAKLASELRRLPTENDLRFKARNDPTYPSNTTFGRLGTKPRVVKMLIEFCERHPEYAEVVPLCRDYKPRQRQTIEDDCPDRTEFGFVYLIKSGRYYKIGRSNHAGRRSYELTIKLPDEAVTVHVIRTDDPVGIEAYWHKRFEAKYRNGEWFDLDASDIKVFKRRKFM